MCERDKGKSNASLTVEKEELRILVKLNRHVYKWEEEKVTVDSNYVVVHYQSQLTLSKK